MPEVLRKVLRATGEAPVVATDSLLSGVGTATAADVGAGELEDSTSTTGSVLDVTADVTDPGSLTYREEWDINADTLPDDEVITKIILYLSVLREDISGTGSGTVVGSVNGADADDTVAIPSTTEEVITYQLDVDPADSQAWTKTKLTDQTFGFYATALSDTANNDRSKVWITEFYIEVYVDQPFANAQSLPEIGEVPHSIQVNTTPPSVWGNYVKQWRGNWYKRRGGRHK